MHECYAMQILETERKKKKKKQRTMVTKNSNEAQGPKKPRQIRDTESHKLLDKVSQTYFY